MPRSTGSGREGELGGGGGAVAGAPRLPGVPCREIVPCVIARALKRVVAVIGALDIGKPAGPAGGGGAAPEQGVALPLGPELGDDAHIAGGKPAAGIDGAGGEDPGSRRRLDRLQRRGGEVAPVQGRQLIPAKGRAAGGAVADQDSGEVHIGRRLPAQPAGAVAQHVDQEVGRHGRRGEGAHDLIACGEGRAGGRGLGAGRHGQGEGAGGRHEPLRGRLAVHEAGDC